MRAAVVDKSSRTKNLPLRHKDTKFDTSEINGLFVPLCLSGVKKLLVILMKTRLLFQALAVLLCLSAVVNASAAVPAQETHYSGMFEIYEANRASGTGNYITADFMAAAYGLFMEDLLTGVEEKEIRPAYQALVKEMFIKLQAGDSSAKGYDTARAYLAVLNRLLDPEAVVPEAAAPKVLAELKLIAEHAGLSPSAVTGVSEDFSQYEPRGKYAKTEPLKQYFRAMLYAGRVGLYLKGSVATGVSAETALEHTAAALLLSGIIGRDKSIQANYRQIDRRLDYFIGKSDDLGPREYLQFAKDLGPDKAGVKILAEVKRRKLLPKIISTAIDNTRLEPGVSLHEAAAAWKLIGQRYTADSDAFQHLVSDKVTDYKGSDTPFTLAVVNGQKVRGFPTALDIMSGLGSKKAAELVTSRGDAAYKGYKPQMKVVSRLLRNGTRNPSSVSAMNLRLARALLRKDTAEGVNGALGVWIRNRHSLVLYAKQSYTVVSKGLVMNPPRSEAAIEPAIGAYKLMEKNLSKIAARLSEDVEKKEAAKFRDVIKKARLIAIKQEKAGLDAADFGFLNSLDAVFKEMLAGPDSPIVVDVHTETNSGLALETALGYPVIINSKSLRGARFNCYEFKQPLAQRLTDEEWQKRLKDGKTEGSLTEVILR